jgi:hypothetical protein
VKKYAVKKITADHYEVRLIGTPEYLGTAVTIQQGRAYCCKCSGPLAAQLTTCRHANAVRRHIAKEIAQ